MRVRYRYRSSLRGAPPMDHRASPPPTTYRIRRRRLGGSVAGGSPFCPGRPPRLRPASALPRRPILGARRGGGGRGERRAAREPLALWFSHARARGPRARTTRRPDTPRGRTLARPRVIRGPGARTPLSAQRAPHDGARPGSIACAGRTRHEVNRAPAPTPRRRPPSSIAATTRSKKKATNVVMTPPPPARGPSRARDGTKRARLRDESRRRAGGTASATGPAAGSRRGADRRARDARRANRKRQKKRLEADRRDPVRARR